jgi:hypothetical protein
MPQIFDVVMRRPSASSLSALAERMSPLDALAVAAVLSIAVIDVAWVRLGHLPLSFGGFLGPLSGCALLLAVAAIYATVRVNPRIAEAALFAALWIAFTVAGCIQTYIATAAGAGRPLSDSAFVAFDAALGFDWVSWVQWVRAHAVVNVILRLGYMSLMPQICLSVLLFAYSRVSGRNAELLLAIALALVATSVISSLLPALGPWVHYGYGALSATDTVYVSHTGVLRSGQNVHFDLSQMQGIVCLPSFHTVMALAFIHAHRGCRTFWPVLALNIVNLASIPSEGGHYLADMVCGASVGIIALVVVRLLCMGGKRPQAELA